ncbi:AAA family ATPase [Acinetobacter sp. ANC 3813]|uniref:AAA family ATPase n=1 Tax=Acinetobacter sp. ANC 3813 TaxID=1977873 RepID=UPI000A34F53C|nr:AAA family ATPase [Acinetobacter sp. ANC 3813]OTG89730.1 ATP-binding protein [Acinetobacter sp. ANC 3813]
MKVESIQLKHTLHFTDLHAEFNYQNAPITLILGDQSTGKTSILRFTYQALTWFAARYKDLRTAGVVMLDHDIMLNRLQSKIDIRISYPAEIGVLSSKKETASEEMPQQTDVQAESYQCAWQLYKTLNAQGMGISKAETQQLEELTARYQRALTDDPLMGMPLIAYYPAERFVNEVNVLNKNNPAIFQPAYAYEISAIPFTTFSRFFEWFREVCDIENAQSAELIQEILHKNKLASEQKTADFLSSRIAQAHAHIHAPALKSLKRALAIVLPEFSNIFLQYHPKLMLMVTYQGQTMQFMQLSNSIRNLAALIGDIVRRMCLLNPASLYPCEEGEGVLLIDAIDHQLDQTMAQDILPRLHQAFPQLQILATGNRSELLDRAAEYQCLQLENKQLTPILPDSVQMQFDEIYAALYSADQDLTAETESQPALLQEPVNDAPTAETLLQQIQAQLSETQQQELIQLLNENHPNQSPNHLL